MSEILTVISTVGRNLNYISVIAKTKFFASFKMT